jgi:hypothetical protein
MHTNSCVLIDEGRDYPGEQSIMSTGTTLYFYVTDQCELCKQAEQVLVETPIDTPIPVEVVDIAESETLVEQYGERIPVLRMDPQGKELNWPFDQNDVINFLGNH